MREQGADSPALPPPHVPGIGGANSNGGHGPVPASFFWGVLGTMRLNSLILALPAELLIEVLGRLDARDLAGALTTCSGLAALKELAWRSATFRRWPEWAAIAAEPSAQWRRQYELLQLREAEAGALPSVAAVRKTQQSVTERHRSILTEWLCEVRGPPGLQRSRGEPLHDWHQRSHVRPAGLLRLGA